MKGMWQRRGGAAALLVAASQPAWAASAYDLADALPQSTVQMFIMLVSLAIFVAVFGAMFYSLLRHRKSSGHQNSHFHEHALVEVVWTVIPFVILVLAAYPATRTIIDHHVADGRQYGEQQVASR